LTSDIDTRKGWPAELLVLLEQHPRDTWRTRGTPMTEFWLHQHAHFRHEAADLKAGTDAYRNDRSTAAEFCNWTAPRLQGFIGHLQGHHQVEDFHYFPAFRAAEQRLASGFDVLANDHELVHEGIMQIVTTFNDLATAVREESPGGDDARRFAADRYIETSELLYKRLIRHLDDEEDLVIPVMLAHGH
jgi:hypothetical protein